MTITENVLTDAAAGLTEVLWQGRRDGCFIAAQAGPQNFVRLHVVPIRNDHALIVCARDSVGSMIERA